MNFNISYLRQLKYVLREVAVIWICLTLVVVNGNSAPMWMPIKLPVAEASSVGMSAKGLGRIDKMIREHVEAGQIQGAVTAIARRGSVIHFSAYGQMDVKEGRAMEHDAIFRMASSSKAVLGVAAMMMIEEGKMRVEGPVSKYIPAFANSKVVEVVKLEKQAVGVPSSKLKKSFGKKVPEYRLVPAKTPVTIHHLLTHTSGLVSGGFGASIADVQKSNSDTLETYIGKLAKVPLDFQPGSKWGYSPRVGLDVVARIIEIVSESTYDQFLRERIFGPLEMNSTYFNLPSNLEAKRVVLNANWAKAKGWGKRTPYFSASGGLSSSAEDYLHFQQMLLNGGELFGRRILSSESVNSMRRNQVGDLFSSGGKKGREGVGFGYTVSVTMDPSTSGDNRGRGSFGWGGAFGTMSWTDPENELVAVIMLQQPHGKTLREFASLLKQAIVD